MKKARKGGGNFQGEVLRLAAREKETRLSRTGKKSPSARQIREDLAKNLRSLKPKGWDLAAKGGGLLT